MISRLCFWLASLSFAFGCRSESPPKSYAYVGREVCAGCHAEESARWAGSDHDLAMAEATPESVLGDFSGVVFEDCGIETLFFRDGEAYFIETQGPTGRPETFPVSYTFGFDPLQQYLIPLEGGRLQAFTIAWDSRRKRWFSLYPGECHTPKDWLHWSNDAMNWNYMCADCHSTHVERNFDVAGAFYRTTFAEIDVSCEACHGPGERHVSLARSDGYGGETGLTVSLRRSSTSMAALASRPDNHAETETCAPCHSRRRAVYPGYHPGKPFLDHFEPELLREELYFPDGRIRDEVYEYGSFVQSKMHAGGVRCSDCHDPHSTDLKLSGNALCLQCHEAAYGRREHVRHAEESPGASCVDCHMPERTYMLVDARRDHSFSIPGREAESPSACLACHEERSAEWAAAGLEEWSGGPSPPHTFAATLAAARRGEVDAEAELIRLISAGELPEIVRATALSLLDGFGTVRGRTASAEALTDAGPLVRAAAIRNLEDVPEAIGSIHPLLTDSVRLVRMEAARVLSRVGGRRSEAYLNALEEYREGQIALNDQAAAHFNLGLLLEREKKIDEAEGAYRTALRLDSAFAPARLNLAMLYNGRRLEAEAGGRPGDAGRLFAASQAELEKAIDIDPDRPDAHFALGLLLAERDDQLSRAAEHLTRAADLDSTDARAAYNAGLAQQRLGNAGAAERLLLSAQRLEPEQPDYLNALSIYYGGQEQWREALLYTERLLRLFPEDNALKERHTYLRERVL